MINEYQTRDKNIIAKPKIPSKVEDNYALQL